MEKMALLAVLFGIILSGVMVDGKANISAMEKELLVEQKLKQLNKPAVKSFQSEAGDIIDCVDIYKQPALDHPLLKDHTIQLKPSFDLSERNENASPPSSFMKESCPEGTVPIRRVLKEHLTNAPSIERFGMKTPFSVRKNEDGLFGHTMARGDASHHEPAVFFTTGSSFTGAKAKFNIWNPRVEHNDEYSTLQVWLANGPSNESNSIEFGWTVNPSVYGDRKTRFFTYWTVDSGKTGCYDLFCPGFIQVDRSIFLGGPFEVVSYTHGEQYIVALEVVLDYGDWWLYYNGRSIGYWPGKLFNHMYRNADIVKWGGDIYSPRLGAGEHTGTQMGSGAFAAEHYGVASYILEPRVQDETDRYVPPYPVFHYVPSAFCYNAESFVPKPGTEPFYFVGGPGRSNRC